MFLIEFAYINHVNNFYICEIKFIYNNIYFGKKCPVCNSNEISRFNTMRKRDWFI